MIGHYLSTLTPEQEARILTWNMQPFPLSTSQCLVQTACPGLETDEAERLTCWHGRQYRGVRGLRRSMSPREMPIYFGLDLLRDDDRRQRQWYTYRIRQHLYSPATAYDHLCVRFGTARVNAAIRNRVLNNHARRALGAVAVGA